MTQAELKTKLHKPYHLNNWKTILQTLLPQTEVFEERAYKPLFEDTDFVIRAFQFGYIEISKSQRLALIDIQLSDNKVINKNRVQLRELAAKVLDGSFQGLLVLFHADNQADYRLSFISKTNRIAEDGTFVTNQTATKRYTYVLGQNESCTTASQRLTGLSGKNVSLEDLTEAFNVDKLNKEFFKGYKDHYENLWQYINGQAEYRNLLIDKEQTELSKLEKPIRDFAKKLLGRIIFLYFLQKKGWMGVPANQSDWKGGDAEFIKNLFQNTINKSTFYSDCLVELFFNTLNSARENDLFGFTGTKVPYLNGGLFDNDAPQTNYFNFPVSYFSELFDFFEQYNFTIDENSPDDAEVGIDPEMLGHIFENLLEENKDKGAFYTPKEVVQFMCQEALEQYLKPHFPEEASIEDFIRKKDISDFLKRKENALKLDKLLSKVRICDPAIGSGAFPIGILQEIFEAKRFIFPFLSTNRFDAAEVKLSIIEKSIYGIDLDKGAVDIARLRFWLALVVDEETPRPLPNLDYKIMQGNSLFDTFEGVDLSKIGTDDDDDVVLEEKHQLDMFGGPKQTLLVFDTASRNDLTSLIKNYFDPLKNNTSKADIKRKIDNKINKKIHTSFEREKLDYRVKIEKQEKLWAEQGVAGRINEKSREMKRYRTWKEQYDKFDEREQNVLELQKKPHEKPFFLWRLFFKEVFDDGGFDIVIGNPPYFSISKQPQLKALATQYKTFESTGDIYALFYERGHQLLQTGGVLVYITGSSWLRSNYGQSLRKFFREETDPLKLIDLSDCQIFESATVLTTIMAYRKHKNTNTLRALRLTRRTQYAVKHLNHYFGNNHVLLQSQPDDAWVILERTRYELKQQIEAKGIKLKNWDLLINYGIKTGFNEAFIIDTTKKNELIEKDIRNKEIIKPILRGRDVGRYSFEFCDLWLIGTFPVLDLDIEEFMEIKSHLLSFGKHRLEQSGEQGSRKKTGSAWFETQDNIAYWKDFEKPKIIYPNMVKDISFAYDDKGFYANQKCFIMTGEKLKYILGVLNSKLFRYAFEENFPELQGNSREINKVVIEEIAIKVPDAIEEKKISRVADYLLYLYNSEHERVNPYADNKQVAGFFEDVMNHLVCELYFAEEMQEANVGMIHELSVKSIENFDSKEQGEIIGEVFKTLQTPGSPVRKSMAMVNIKLPNTVGKILSNTI